MAAKKYLSAKEAAAALDISLPTLYAYVSRGLIRSEPTAGSSRARRYRREDVEVLLAKKQVRQQPEKAVESALHFGTPILASALTLIENGRLYYRGQDATTLALNEPVESVAALLWDIPAARLSWPAAEPALPPFPETVPPIGRLQMVLPLAAADDIAAYDLKNATAVAQAGTRIMQLFVHLLSERPFQGSIAATLQRAWCPTQPAATALLNAALVLCADHELNVSSFTARCVASTGATPYAVVQAGLAALQGVRHGGSTERVEALFAELDAVADARAMVAGRLRRGELIHGFGHPLYPEGDPRARLLLAQITAVFPHNDETALFQELQQAVTQSIGILPNVDFALVALRRVLQLPVGAALSLFALSRTAGWIGHAIEQYALDQLIRPRARYTGILPEEDNL